MVLSRTILKTISSAEVPDGRLFELPEKVIQFGTGVLLRGLPDYYIDKANRNGLFNGRIVLVKSTSQGDTDAFSRQDGLYTVAVRGMEHGKNRETFLINASISRVLSANIEWHKVLRCAHNPNIQVVISNTTEKGIELVAENISLQPPRSYPGKLLALLYERFKAFGGSRESGLVIIPTELLPDNGGRLQAIVLELAHLNGLENEFIEWVECCNTFCSSLVDRIVPGHPQAGVLQAMARTLGYEDELLIETEVYNLWAIEGDAGVKKVLSFAEADKNVVVEPDIERYRELKLRILNGTHTLSCAVAFFAGCQTVKEAMNDRLVSGFIEKVMLEEITPCLPPIASLEEAVTFAKKTIERFRNPYLQHQWIDIAKNLSLKMKLRCVPVLLKHYTRSKEAPAAIALGFAAYLFFMKPAGFANPEYTGMLHDTPYPVQDELKPFFYTAWQTLPPSDLVRAVLSETAFWEEDLSALPGFADSVTGKLTDMINNGIRKTLMETLRKNIPA